MKKELTSLEIAEQIIRDVCCGNGSQKKKKTRKLSKMVETDIDIFATDEKEQYRSLNCRTKKEIDDNTTPS